MINPRERALGAELEAGGGDGDREERLGCNGKVSKPSLINLIGKSPSKIQAQ